MSNERQHHKLSPSNYPSWEACACFDSDNSRSVEAENGIYSHEVFEALNNGSPFKDGDQDLIDRATWAHDTLARMSEGSPSGIVSESEVRIKIDEFHDEIYGYCDCSWQNKDSELCVGDYKTYKMVDDDPFAQVYGYAVGLCQASPAFKDKPIHCYVFAGGSRQVFSRVTTYADALQRVRNVIARREDANAKPCPSDQCKYCSHKRLCRGVDLAVATVENKAVFSKLTMPEQFLLLKAVKGFAEKRLDEIKEEAIKAGGTLSGGNVTIKVHSKNGKMLFNDLPALASAFKEKAGIQPGDFIRLCSVSKTVLMNALRPKGPDGKFLRSEKEAMEILKPYATYSSPSTELRVA